MDTTKLKVFIEAINTGSLRKAAVTLDYTQPTLTSMMDSLEEDLGVSLLKRDHRGVSLTPEGERLKPYIEKLLSAEKQLYQAASSLQEPVVTFGVLPSVAGDFIPQVMKSYQKKYANIKLKMVTGTSSLPRYLEDDLVDFIITDTTHSRSFDTIELKKDDFFALVPSREFQGKTHVTSEDLKGHILLLPDADRESTPVRALKDLQEFRYISLDTSHPSVLISMVEQGMGIAFISSVVQTYDSSRVRLLPVVPAITRTLCVCTKSLHDLSTASKRFIKEIKEYLTEKEL